MECGTLLFSVQCFYNLSIKAWQTCASNTLSHVVWAKTSTVFFGIIFENTAVVTGDINVLLYLPCFWSVFESFFDPANSFLRWYYWSLSLCHFQKQGGVQHDPLHQESEYFLHHGLGQQKYDQLQEKQNCAQREQKCIQHDQVQQGLECFTQ